MCVRASVCAHGATKLCSQTHKAQAKYRALIRVQSFRNSLTNEFCADGKGLSQAMVLPATAIILFQRIKQSPN